MDAIYCSKASYYLLPLFPIPSKHPEFLSNSVKLYCFLHIYFYGKAEHLQFHAKEKVHHSSLSKHKKSHCPEKRTT